MRDYLTGTRVRKQYVLKTYPFWIMKSTTKLDCDISDMKTLGNLFSTRIFLMTKLNLKKKFWGIEMLNFDS